MDRDGALKSAFVIAAREGQAEIVELLLEAGVDVHVWEDVALRLAADGGHAETVKVLLNAGADVHAKDDEALRSAEENGYRETVAILREGLRKPPSPGSQCPK